MARDPQILWRRLDLPGHDACRIREDGNRQGLEGCAVRLDPSDWALKRLPQSYRHIPDGWHYAASGFETDLHVDADGFVTDYPGLWIKEDPNGRP